MTYAARRFLVALGFAFTAAVTSLYAATSPTAALAQGLAAQPKYAAIVVDANTGEVLYAKRADAQRFPASITKVMTLYLTFEGLATGRLSLDERVPVSVHAASMAPSKLGVRPGGSLTVDEAIRAVAVHSSNDIAVALAERISGSEPRFAQLMTIRAQELGMTNSRFVNASGLPDTRQVSSARDIALLSRAVMRDYPQYYAYFGQKSYDYHGKLLTNHNRLLLKMPGMDGLKTGFTNAAGFNLAASAVRGGRRLITVVLGGPSTAARDENVEELLTAGFDVLDRRAHGQRLTLASAIDSPDDMSGPVVRAPAEEGSGEQPDLKVVVQPQVRTMPMLAAARTFTPEISSKLPAVVARLDSDLPCQLSRRRGRHAERRTCVIQAPGGTEAAPASRATPLLATSPCTRRGHHQHRASCQGAAAAQVASRAPLRGTARADGKGRESGATEEADKPVAGVTSSGGYTIQVGAYKNQGQAKDHLDAVSGSFGRAVDGASPQVEKSGGNYRVRFKGLSEKQARAACRAMMGRGQKCLVLGQS